MVRSQRKRQDGRLVWAFGARVGYWPCLKALFIRFDLGPIIAEAWVGWPTYLVAREGRRSW